MGKGKIFMGLRRIFSAVSFWLIQEFCEICGFSLKNVIDGQPAAGLTAPFLRLTIIFSGWMVLQQIDHPGATGEAKLARALASPSGLASGTPLGRLINNCKTIKPEPRSRVLILPPGEEKEQ
jgi:hypothetical protein